MDVFWTPAQTLWGWGCIQRVTQDIIVVTVHQAADPEITRASSRNSGSWKGDINVITHAVVIVLHAPRVDYLLMSSIRRTIAGVRG